MKKLLIFLLIATQCAFAANNSLETEKDFLRQCFDAYCQHAHDEDIRRATTPKHLESGISSLKWAHSRHRGLTRKFVDIVLSGETIQLGFCPQNVIREGHRLARYAQENSISSISKESFDESFDQFAIDEEKRIREKWNEYHG